MTVVTDNERHQEVVDILKECNAVQVDIRHSFWDHGNMDEYEEITNEERDQRSRDG
jgi:hypothetical protein